MLVGAAFLAYLGVEGASNPTPVSVSAQEAHDTGDFGSRTYATVDGRVSFTYIETYEDENDDQTRDAGEDSLNWFYYLLDIESGEGVAVRSGRSPDDVFRYEASGTLVSDAEFVKPDLDDMRDVIEGANVTMEDVVYLDATGPAPADAAPIDFANPQAGSAVSVAGTGFGWLYWCSDDVNGNGTCDDDEVDQHDILVYDPATLRGIVVSDTYLLAEGDAPASPGIVLPIAGLLAVVGAIMLMGVAGGHLVYRRQTDARSVPRFALETGQEIPLRVTGTLMTPGGLVHVR